MQTARNGSRSGGCNNFQLTFRPRRLWSPIRLLNENIAEALLNYFMKVSQRKKQQNITLWGEPFTVTVSTVNVNGLPQQKN